jgi:hypothetical protein
MAGGDAIIRNSPIPNTVEGAFEDARSWLENYETIFSPQDDGSPGRLTPVSGSKMRILPPGNTLPRKRKRKVSRYQREFGKQLKKLKKKHPRTSIGVLMKRAHRATRKALK